MQLPVPQVHITYSCASRDEVPNVDERGYTLAQHTLEGSFGVKEREVLYTHEVELPSPPIVSNPHLLAFRQTCIASWDLLPSKLSFLRPNLALFFPLSPCLSLCSPYIHEFVRTYSYIYCIWNMTVKILGNSYWSNSFYTFFIHFLRLRRNGRFQRRNDSLENDVRIK